eukprot:CAMPEP_0171497978 /NCGR_PEP_ID=MMETSP0958-20121227/7583_1 /TAXON_ID=87120 /ORGANISM="Aurantiochytrium limacinum, Strain ATCCMYA-1381" /LENGTH=436 /DNA_ID=CAMNT_0012032303 /DNA_START=299 /DNA_END=1609 /DNA_ORIENTATION=-
MMMMQNLGVGRPDVVETVEPVRKKPGIDIRDEDDCGERREVSQDLMKKYFRGHEDFWREHLTWRQNVINQTLDIEVGDPIQGPRSITNPSPPVYFKVAVRDRGIEVRRRYSEFEFLQNVLEKRYAGLAVPRLPEKRVVKTTEFLKERARELTLFIKGLLRVAYFRADSTVLAFIGDTDSRRWEALKASVAASQPGTALDRNREDGNEGKRRWLEVMQHFQLPRGAELSFWHISQHLCALSQLLASMAEAIGRMTDAATEYAIALRDLAQRVEYPNCLALSGHASPPLHEAVHELDGFISQWSQVSSSYPSILMCNLYQVVRQELDDVIEVQRLMSRLENLNHTIAKLEQSIQQHHREQAEAKGAGRPDRVPKVLEKLTRVSYTKKLADTERDQIIKALLLADTEHFVERKTEVLRNLGSSFAVPYRKYLVSLEDLL